MHFNFDFSSAQILWTLTFAALLVLLVVLLGRDRVSRFPWFTTAMALTALRMLASRLLYHRVSLAFSESLFLSLADLAAIITVLMVIEIARRAFAGAGRRAWIAGTLVLVAVAGTTTALWGPWPSLKTLFATSQLAAFRFMELFAQKADMFGDVLIVLLALLILIFGRQFKAGWHSHAQQLVIGLAMASISQLTIRGILQHVATHVTIHSQNDYKRVMNLMNSLNTANSVIFLAAVVWWVICLWIDEPGASASAGSAESEAHNG